MCGSTGAHGPTCGTTTARCHNLTASGVSGMGLSWPGAFSVMLGPVLMGDGAAVGLRGPDASPTILPTSSLHRRSVSEDVGDVGTPIAWTAAASSAAAAARDSVPVLVADASHSCQPVDWGSPIVNSPGWHRCHQLAKHKAIDGKNAHQFQGVNCILQMQADWKAQARAPMRRCGKPT